MCFNESNLFISNGKFTTITGFVPLLTKKNRDKETNKYFENGIRGAPIRSRTI